MKTKTLNTPQESFRFRIPGYGLDHQDGAIVDLAINLDFKDDVGATDPFAYPEFVSVVNFIKDYLVNYPNEGDFWEIVNKNLVTALLSDTIPTTFGVEYHLDEVVDSLTVDLDVSQGSSLVGFPRSSTVTGTPGRKGIDYDQSFSFQIPGYGLDHQDGAIVDLAVDLNFKEDIAIDDPFEYPEFVSIVNFIKDYLVNYPNERDFWEILNKNLVTSLLRETIPTTFGVDYHLDEVVDSLTVDLDVSQGSSLVGFPRSSTVTGTPGRKGIDYDQSFSFRIPGYGLDHQDGAIVDLAVELNFKEDIAIDDPFEYPEFVSIVNFIKDYLVSYPNERDFWEIVNKNLVTALLNETIPTTFGVEYHLDEVVDSLTVDLDVSQGSSLVGFPRSSTVTGTPGRKGIDFDESFSFVIPDYGLDHQDGAIVDIYVDLDFKENIGVDNPFEYPEFVSIVNFIKDYLVNYPNERDFWEILNKNLAAALLTETIPTDFGVEYQLREVVDSVNVDIQVQAGSSLVNFPRASTVRQSVNRDPRISLAVSEAEVREDGAADLVYTFRRTGSSGDPLTVNYSLAGSASAGDDYRGAATTAGSGSVTFAAGASRATVRLHPTADARQEPHETVAVTLTAGEGYRIGTRTAVSSRILNDDIASAITYRLRAGESTLSLLGDRRIDGIGNPLDNRITGNSNSNQLVGGGGADVLRGGGSDDRFAYTSLEDSLLGGGRSLERILDFSRGDRIIAPAPVDAAPLSSALGRATALTPDAIAAVLTRGDFPADAVAAFTVEGSTGTFIAMNDERPGFQAGSDAILFLHNYAISDQNMVMII